MFSTKEFIEASRDFVCVRLETFENKEHQAMVREILNGRFANTAFALFAPDGEEQLSRGGRGPKDIIGASGRGPNASPGTPAEVAAAMKEIAGEYSPRGQSDEMVLQDFHTFRQALNVASGDQRLLLFVAASSGDHERIRETLRPIFAEEAIIGRFHLDFGTAEPDASWSEKISGVKGKSGFVIIQAGQFGLEGKALAHLPLNTDAETLMTALLSSNATYADTEERKDYSQHVREGRQERIYFENEIPYGEDRDGDGEIDNARGGKGGKGGKGEKGKR
ncbi:MAG: hypothetical protein AAF491_04185 [Verrucomicrobiota bacterium]